MSPAPLRVAVAAAAWALAFGCASQRAAAPAESTAGSRATSPGPVEAHRAKKRLSFPASCEGPSPECRKSAPKELACPSSRDAIFIGEVCGVVGTTASAYCDFETSRCRCVHRPYCGGAAPSFLQSQGMRWECAPPRREGDCPDEAPVAGAACTETREPCGSSTCGSSTVCTCQAGRWACETRRWPPPP